ncbi:MAG: HAD family phosphatase [Patescibacteria group bacterium]|nr:HAD family phosphatase [Patescibacteria group bacterium]
MIKAVTFDLDGVYFPVGKEKFIQSLVGLGISDSEARRVFLKSGQMNKLYKNGKMTDEEFWTWAAKEWGFAGSWNDLTDKLITGYAVDPDVAGVVKSIRRRGYKTLICSNNFRARVDGLQEKFKFLDDFDAAVFSYEVGESKPSEKIFKELIRRSVVEPSEIVFTDDNPERLAGAKNLGITTFLYEGFNKFVERLRTLGVKI